MPGNWIVFCEKSADQPKMNGRVEPILVTGCPKYGSVLLVKCRECSGYSGEEPG